MITENLSTLKIHKLTQEQYDRELAAGRIDESALYLTPDHEDIYAEKEHGNHVPAVETMNPAKFLRNDNTWQMVTPGNIGAAPSIHGSHVTFTTTLPTMDGTANVGTSSYVARSDHKHPTDTSRAAASDLTAHTGNTSTHVSQVDRLNWDLAGSHTSNTNVHVTSADKTKWNGHIDATSSHVSSNDRLAWDNANYHISDTNKHVTINDKNNWNNHTADTNSHVSSSDRIAWDYANKHAGEAYELARGKADARHTHIASEVGADPLGSASNALSDAKDYTDTKIKDALVDIANGGSASQTASYAVTETGWTRIAKLSDSSILTRFDISVAQPRLSAPSVTLDGNIVSFEIDRDAEIGVILVDGEETTMADGSFDLSTLNLFAGRHRVTVKSIGTGWLDSAESVPVEYNVAFDAGLYDANNNLVATWSTLVNDYGMNVEGNYNPGAEDWEGRKAGHPASILAENPELSKGTKLVIPGTVSWIGMDTFEGYSEPCKLTEVVLLDGVDRINQGAFGACDNLTRVVIPDSVTTIGDMAFQYCDSLYKIEIPSGVTNIGMHAFTGCVNLVSVKFNVGLKNIENGAFEDCPIQKVILPDGLESIGYQAFKGCMATNVTIPKSAKCSPGAFYGCPNMQDVFVENGNKHHVTHTVVDDDGKKHRVLLDINSVEIVQFPTGYSGSFSVPFFVKAIGLGAFGGSLVGDIYLPNSLERIEDFAFSCCGELNILAIPQSVTYIGSYAFEYCGKLVGEWDPVLGDFILRIAGSLEDIGNHLFLGCRAMVGIYFENGLPKLEGYSFIDCFNLKYISIPDTVVAIGEDIINVLAENFQFIFRGTEEFWNNVQISAQKVNWLDNIVFLDEAPA